MKRFVLKIGLLLAVNAAVGFAALWLVDAGRSLAQWESDSVLLATPRNTEFDLVILGSSRAKLFTRLKPNLECLEHDLNMKVLGMATPFGGGIVPAEMYLNNFYEQGNQAKTVLLFLDPFMLFSRGPNEDHKFVTFEPFRFSFLEQMLRNGFGQRPIRTYVRSKFSWAWIHRKPVELGYNAGALTAASLDSERTKMRMDSLFPEGLNEANLERYTAVLDRVLSLGEKYGARVIVAFPPTLLGPDPGRERVLAVLDELKKRHDFAFYDFSHEIVDPGLYSDYDHLNSMGVAHFVTEYLRPALME